MRKVKSMKERREKSRSEFPWRKYTFFQEGKKQNGVKRKGKEVCGDSSEYIKYSKYSMYLGCKERKKPVVVQILYRLLVKV